MRYLLILAVASGMLAMPPRHAVAQTQAQVLCERILASPRGLEPFGLRVVAAPNGEYVALGQAGPDSGPPVSGGLSLYYAATHFYLARLTSGCDTVWQRWVPHLADTWGMSGLAVDRYGIWALTSDTVYNYYTQRQRSRARLWRFTPTGRMLRSLVVPPRSYPEYPCALLPAPGGGCYANVSSTGPVSRPLSGFTGQSLLRLDSTGRMQWRRDYPLVLANALCVLAPSLRGTLLLAGTAKRTPAFDHYPKIIEVETSRGDSVGGAFVSPPPGFLTEYMNSSDKEPHDLIPLTRGRGYALTTKVFPDNSTTPPITGAVVRLDADYRVLWRYQYPNSQSGNEVSFTQVRELADGSLLALASPFRSARRCWLYRLDGATGALLGAYAVPQGVGARPIKVNYLLPVAADSPLLLVGQAELGLADGGLYVARVRIPNLPRVVTGTAGGTAPAAGLALAWQVYPNPATGAATLWLPAALLRHGAGVALYNALGQRVQGQGQAVPAAAHETRVPLALTGLPPGVYAVQLTTPGGTTVRRLVVE